MDKKYFLDKFKKKIKQVSMVPLAISFLAGGFFFEDAKIYLKNFYESISHNSNFEEITENFKKNALKYPSRLEDRIEEEGSKPNNSPDKFGVIIIGDDSVNFHKEGGRCYQTLLENNFNRNRIYVLSKSGKMDFCHPTGYVATKDSFLMLMNHLSRTLDKKDLFLLYMTGQGIEPPQYRLNDKNELIKISRFSFGNRDYSIENSLTSIELANSLSYINSDNKIIIIDACLSGGNSDFMKLDNFFTKNNKCTIITSSGFLQRTYSSDNYSFSGFLFGALSPWNKEEVDENKDGRISLGESFRDALKKLEIGKKEISSLKNVVQTPQYYSPKSLDEIFID